MSEVTPFNHKSVCKAKIDPLIQQIKQICIVNNMPFFICVPVSNDEKGTKYEYDGLMPNMFDINLTDDHLAKHLLVARGFDVRPAGQQSAFEEVAQAAIETFEQLRGKEDEDNA